ncbi:MAG: hypothetical protein HY904_06765 [Deltaproteobacteria bacterium]|nr:hypothetical protein [Deltaproteobacteria bacterium]
MVFTLLHLGAFSAVVAASVAMNGLDCGIAEVFATYVLAAVILPFVTLALARAVAGRRAVGGLRVACVQCAPAEVRWEWTRWWGRSARWALALALAPFAPLVAGFCVSVLQRG